MRKGGEGHILFIFHPLVCSFSTCIHLCYVGIFKKCPTTGEKQQGSVIKTACPSAEAVV